MDKVGTLQVTPEAIAGLLGQGGYWSRADIARAFNREKSSWLIGMVEIAVELGLIRKHAGYSSGWRKAWVYCHPQFDEQQPLVLVYDEQGAA